MTKILLFDIDNTLHDWVAYFVPAHTALLEALSLGSGIPVTELVASMREVYEGVETLEYGFVAQETPALKNFFGTSAAFLKNAPLLAKAKEAFARVRAEKFRLYDGVKEGLKKLREHPAHPLLCAITDAPIFQASQRLRKGGIDHLFDVLFAQGNPLPPPEFIPPTILADERSGRFDVATQQITLPPAMEKPWTDLNWVREQLEKRFPEKQIAVKDMVVIGDHPKKDGGLAARYQLPFIQAGYGPSKDEAAWKKLAEWAPTRVRAKNVAEKTIAEIKPTCVAQSFEEVVRFLEEGLK